MEVVMCLSSSDTDICRRMQCDGFAHLSIVCSKGNPFDYVLGFVSLPFSICLGELKFGKNNVDSSKFFTVL